MFFCGVGRLEAQLCSNFGPRGRRPGAGNGAPDKIKDLLLAVSELGSGEHVDSCERRKTNKGWVGAGVL